MPEIVAEHSPTGLFVLLGEDRRCESGSEGLTRVAGDHSPHMNAGTKNLLKLSS